MAGADRRLGEADRPSTLARRLVGRTALRTRLTVVFAIAMTVGIVAIGAVVYVGVRADLLAAVDRDLGARADALTAALAADPTTRLESGHRFVDPDEAFAQILRPDGGLVDATAGMSAGPLLTAGQLARTDRPSFSTRSTPGLDDEQRLLALPAEVGGQQRVIVVGVTLGDRHEALVNLVVVLVVAGSIAVALACLGGWLLAGAALRPVERMRRHAAELAVGDSKAVLPVPSTGDELSRLGTTLNSLLERQRAAADRELRFVDEASHELRTPLAVLKAELDVSLSRDRTAPELVEALRAASRETDRLCALTDELLVLARSRQEGAPVRRDMIWLPALLRTSVKPLAGLTEAMARPVEVRAEEVSVWVDGQRLGQAVYNLTENALRHGAGLVTVTGEVTAGTLLLDVRDEGSGIPGSLRDNAFDPFRSEGRLDRSGGHGQALGHGLGLYIVRVIAVAHGGTAQVLDPCDGAGVRLEIPGVQPGG